MWSFYGMNTFIQKMKKSKLGFEKCTIMMYNEVDKSGGKR